MLKKSKNPIVLSVQKGQVVTVEGGARLTGNVQEEKIKLGTAHFALENILTLGGRVKSKTHLDAVVNNARVVTDGRVALEDGRPCW